MSVVNVNLLIAALVFLILLSAFFSGSETGMMSINRYRLRHLLRSGVPAAKRVADLLERPDRLLGVILIGNTFANILASALATVVAVHFFGDLGVLVATVLLTLIILIFAETTPKTMAALHPERFAFFVSYPLKWLLKVMYPLVVFVNAIANSTLRLFKVHVDKRGLDPLSIDELRTIVNEATGKISANYQAMLLSILDLERVTVADIMVPRNEIHGIDLQQDWEVIEQQIITADHAFYPVYRENLDKVQGILNVRKVIGVLQQGELSKTKLQKLIDKVYFVPETAQLNRQLLNFQSEQKSVALVVDEYGDVEGLVTLQDVLEEIVGEFGKSIEDQSNLVKTLKDGSVLVDGRINVRDLMRLTGWKLPVAGPKTISGLVIEYLEMIPTVGVAARIAGYPMEVKKVRGNMVRQVQVWPKLYRE